MRLLAARRPRSTVARRKCGRPRSPPRDAFRSSPSPDEGTPSAIWHCERTSISVFCKSIFSSSSAGQQAVLRGLRRAAIGFFQDDCREAHHARCGIESGDRAAGAGSIRLAIFVAAHDAVSYDVQQRGAVQLLDAILRGLAFPEKLSPRDDLNQTVSFRRRAFQTIQPFCAKRARERRRFGRLGRSTGPCARDSARLQAPNVSPPRCAVLTRSRPAGT